MISQYKDITWSASHSLSSPLTWHVARYRHIIMILNTKIRIYKDIRIWLYLDFTISGYLPVSFTFSTFFTTGIEPHNYNFRIKIKDIMTTNQSSCIWKCEMFDLCAGFVASLVQLMNKVLCICHSQLLLWSHSGSSLLIQTHLICEHLWCYTILIQCVFASYIVCLSHG